MTTKNRPEFEILNKMRLHLLLTVGGLGDCIHCIPALDHIFKYYPHQKYVIHPPDYLVPLFKKLYPKVPVKPLSEAPTKVDGKTAGIISPTIQRNSSMHVHLTDFAYYMFLDKLPEKPKDRNLRLFNPRENVRHLQLPRNYIAISPYWRVNLREMPASTLDAVVRWANERGLTAVILGSTGQIYNKRGDIKTDGTLTWKPKPEADILDLSNRTDVLQTLQVLWQAKALVTMDGGLLHLCALSKTPVVAGFTSVDPKTRIPYRSGKPMEQIKTVLPEVSCRFCQTRICMVYNGQHEFNKCYYGDRQCVNEMSANKFISQLEEIWRC